MVRRRLLAGLLSGATVLAFSNASTLPAGARAPAAGRALVVGPVATAHAALAPLDTSRPVACPAPNADPNSPNDGAKASASGTVPWPAPPAGRNPLDYAAYLHTSLVGGYPERPANWDNGGGSWKLTSARTSDPLVSRNPQELCGVEGNSVDKAWEITTGRPDTVIAITDSGIEWCDTPVLDKIALNRAALPYPENAQGLTKPELEMQGVHFTDADPYDLYDTGVFNVAQYRADPRVLAWTKARWGGLFCGNFISPEDLIRTFGASGSPWYYPLEGTAGHPAEAPRYPGQSPPGFTEAIAGWNFVDNTNDPYDDVLYGHGTGEAEDSTGAADSAGEVGTCPSCSVLPIRVGESFIAEGSAFAQGVLFAVDSGASVIQEALGTLDVTTTDAQAIAYAAVHGVPVIASAADEEAEHHNEPGNLPGTIVVNSVTQAANEAGVPLEEPQSYLYLNGCTNYGANIAVSVESSSCSSEATGKTGGVTGLIESEARNLLGAGRLSPYPGLRTVSGAPVGLSATEVRELIEMSADNIDFQTPVIPTLAQLATTNPEPPDNYAVISPLPTLRYPSQPGYGMYFGYGRLDAATALQWLAAGRIPPEASFGAMQWFQTYDPSSQAVPVPVYAAAVRTPGVFHWELQYGIGPQPPQGAWTDLVGGSGVGGPAGHALSETITLSPALLAQIAAQLPGPDVDPPGQPNTDSKAFTLRLVVTDAHGLVGMDRRTEYLNSDPSLITGSVVEPSPAGGGTVADTVLATAIGGSIDAAPTLAPIGPGGTDALVVATADGVVHAYVPALGVSPPGRLVDLPGWPVYTNLVPGQAELSAREPAFASGQVTTAPRCSIIGGVAVGNLLGTRGPPDVVASDMCGYVYAWSAAGHLLSGFPVRTDPAYSQDPAPYAGTPAATNPSVDPRDPDNRLLPGILGAPSLASLDGGAQLDIVASSLDRHVYAWTPAGRPVPGFPVLVVDPATVASVEPITDHVAFKPAVNVQMGSMILDTPAVGNLLGTAGPPDLVIGTDEEYGCDPASIPGTPLALEPSRPPCAISFENPVNFALDAVGSQLLSPANSELYALSPRGSDAGAGTFCSRGTAQPDACAILPGWPAQMVDLDAGLLPDVADGTTAPPALADLSGNGQLDVGDMTSVGPAYVFTPFGKSYLGTGLDGEPIGLSMADVGPLSNAIDIPSIPSVGMPIFANLGSPLAPGISLIAPATSLGKALDAAFPADQVLDNANQVDAWNPATGLEQAAFPQAVNDLQFFDQPLAANLNGAAGGTYVVEGSATSDVRAVNAAGVEAPGFPKFTGGWIVNSPSFGPLGSVAEQVLAAGTRDGNLFVWATPTPACAWSGPWPRQHHDVSNSNNLNFVGEVKPTCAAG